MSNLAVTDILISLTVLMGSLVIWYMRQQRQINCVRSQNLEGTLQSVSLSPYGVLDKIAEWTALPDFKYPEFEPLYDFDVLNTKSIPYRPFR
jgi:hypothetical protein